MENTEILALAYELKEKIENSELYKNLKNNEKAMVEDEECFKLLYLYQNLQNEYNEAKRFEKYGSDVEGVQKRLFEIKYKVDENELVKKYNESYKLMRKELKNIEKIMFKDIIKERKEIDII